MRVVFLLLALGCSSASAQRAEAGETGERSESGEGGSEEVREAEALRAESPPPMAPESTDAQDESVAALLAAEQAADESEWQAERARRQAHLDEFRRVVEPLDAGLAEQARRMHASEDYGATFDAVERQGHVLVSMSESGNGVESTWSASGFVFHEGTLRLRVRYGGADGYYVQRLELSEGLSPRVRSSLELLFQTPVIRDARTPRHGLAELFLGGQRPVVTNTPFGFRVVGPLLDANGEASFPLPPGNDSASTTSAMLIERGGEIFRIAPVQTDCPEIRVGTQRLRHCRLVGRNGGVAVALMNGRNVGRWVLETRYAVLGGELEWMGEYRGWLFGYYGHSHPGGRYAGSAGIVALRVRDGAVFRVDVPGAFVDGYRVDHFRDEARLMDMQDACVEAELAQRGLSEVDEAIFNACKPASPLTLNASGLEVTLPDGAATQIEFDELLQALPR